jgi:phosphoribosylaminoimidazolecarboxamide formyltransferase / IMP cyclohydrolase
MPGNIVDKIDNFVKINTVLISVYNKAGMEKFVQGLVRVNPNIKIISTGGTFTSIEKALGDKASAHLQQVSDYTGQPETQGGLVKTLDFKIYLGLLTETYNDDHKRDMARTGALPIDMVVVNLYPFGEVITEPGVTPEKARANIDIGGPCMVRASAKNYLRVASVTDARDYDLVLAEMGKNGGRLSLAFRFELARKAFAYTAGYDATIAAHLKSCTEKAVAASYDFKD